MAKRQNELCYMDLGGQCRALESPHPKCGKNCPFRKTVWQEVKIEQKCVARLLRAGRIKYATEYVSSLSEEDNPFTRVAK